ncbi:MAG: translation initiation factor IF-2 subunit alpha [Halobacteria archaeon]
MNGRPPGARAARGPAEGWPTAGELVLCTVRDVQEFGAFVTLDEFGERKGFIPISHIARGWIRNIREHVRKGGKVVARVLAADPGRGRIDLSLKDVNEHQRKDKVKAWKNEEKAVRWLTQKFPAERAEAIRAKLRAAVGGLHPALEESLAKGSQTFTGAGLDPKTAEALHAIARESIVIPEARISGVLELTVPGPRGVEVLRKALTEAARASPGVEVACLGAPRYRVAARAPDFKKAEAALRKSSDAALAVVQKASGKGQLLRAK